jgi:hypothetical protein
MTEQILTHSVAWKCANCRTAILGYSNREKSMIAVKYKDMYVHITGNDVEVKTLCRKCGFPNTIINKKIEQ